MKRFGKPLRILVSIGLFAWLGSMMDWASLRSTIADADPVWLIVPHAVTLITFFACVWRWQVLLRARGVRVTNGDATRYLLIGHFISNFFPSNVGGDVARATLVTRRLGRARWTTIAGSVVVDRMTGLFAILFVLPVLGLLHWDWLAELHLLAPLGFACLGIFGLTVFVFSDWGARLIRWFGRWRLLRKPVNIVASLHEAMLAYRRAPGAVVTAIAISIPFYFANGVQVWILSYAFPGGPVAWTVPVLMFCAISLLSMLPISFNGYGLQEGGYALLFVSLGYTENAAVAIAVAARLLSIAISVVGGAMFATSDLSKAEFSPEPAVSTPVECAS